MSAPDRPLPRPFYWAEACRHLVKRDRVLRRLIPRFPGAALQSGGDAFTTLARSVTGQQISVQSAQAVWERLLALQPEFTPRGLLALAPEVLRGAGLSTRKIDYLSDLARHFESGLLHVDDWHDMDDESIIQELSAIRGVGRWTAEMFLIFHLLRPNVLPLDDAGLIRGISANYFSGEPVSRSEAREVAAAWSPYCSVATWYIWRSLDPVPAAA